MFKKFLMVVAVIVIAVGGLLLIKWVSKPKPGQVKDEALLAGFTADKFVAADEDYFRDMDGGVRFEPGSPEIKGRNTWIVWTAGNDRMWDALSVTSFGALDFLKTLSSHPGLSESR